MSFNQYTWDLYKQTTIGIEMIKYFSDAGGYVLFKDYCPYANFIPEDLYNDWLENIYCYGVSDYDHPSSLEEAKDLYISLITLGIRVEGQQWLPANDFKNMLGIIQPMSNDRYFTKSTLTSQNPLRILSSRCPMSYHSSPQNISSRTCSFAEYSS